MHWARFCAAAAILALTLLTFASCGPLAFKGTDLLLNRFDTGSMDKALSGMVGGIVPGDAKPAESKESEVKTIFEDGDRWMHFLYIGLVVVAVLGLVVKPRLFVLIGALGIALTIVFMVSFQGLFERKGGEDSKSSGPNPLGATMSLDWKEGAWLALAGFAGIAIAGLQGRAKKAAAPEDAA